MEKKTQLPYQDDTEYKKLLVYDGTKTACDNCNRPLLSGEVISVSSWHDLIFCYSDERAGCACGYNISIGKNILYSPMRFGDGMLSPEQRYINYPNTPIRPSRMIQKEPRYTSFFRWFS